jgi:hypothetical protein
MPTSQFLNATQTALDLKAIKPPAFTGTQVLLQTMVGLENTDNTAI